MRDTWVRSLGWEDPLEKGKATHSSIWPGVYSPWGCKALDMKERLSYHVEIIRDLLLLSCSDMCDSWWLSPHVSGTHSSASDAILSLPGHFVPCCHDIWMVLRNLLSSFNRCTILNILLKSFCGTVVRVILCGVILSLHISGTLERSGWHSRQTLSSPRLLNTTITQPRVEPTLTANKLETDREALIQSRP